MQVKVYAYDYRKGRQIYQHEAELAECFPDQDAEYHAARDELQRSGRYWVGGGAAPLFLLMATGERT